MLHLNLHKSGLRQNCGRVRKMNWFWAQRPLKTVKMLSCLRRAASQRAYMQKDYNKALLC